MAPAFSLSLTTGGGDVLVGFNGLSNHNEGTAFDIRLHDGSYLSGGKADGIIRSNVLISFVVLVRATDTGMTEPGTYTFDLMWRTRSTSSTLHNNNLATQFWAREVS